MSETPAYIVATDIYSVKQVGVDQWMHSFFWPMGNGEFSQFVTVVGALLADLCGAASPRIRDLILADLSMIGEIFEHVLACCVKKRCEANRLPCITGSLSAPLYSPDWPLLAKRYGNIVTDSVLRDRFKELLKNLYFNSHAVFTEHLAAFAGRGGVIGLGSNSRLKNVYIRKKGVYCRNMYASSLLNGCPKSGAGQLEALPQKQLFNMLQQMDAAARDCFGVGFDVSEALNAWIVGLADLYRLYRFVHHRMAKHNILFLTEGAKPLHKIIALAARRRGIHVVGFTHGNEVGIFENHLLPFVETAQCDTFVCHTAAVARNLSNIIKRSPLGGCSETACVSANDDFFYKLWRRAQHTVRPRRIQKLMIVGFPMTARRGMFHMAGNFFAFQLDLEIRLMAAAKSVGVEVIYKMHPDRRKEAEGIFDTFCDRIVVEPFEDVLDMADAYLFNQIGTTTFGIAVCMNKPVITIDLADENWNPDVRPLLERRCVSIAAKMDHRQRIRFDEAALKNVLTQPVGEIDFSYVRHYMFPEGAH